MPNLGMFGPANSRPTWHGGSISNSGSGGVSGFRMPWQQGPAPPPAAKPAPPPAFVPPPPPAPAPPIEADAINEVVVPEPEGKKDEAPMAGLMAAGGGGGQGASLISSGTPLRQGLGNRTGAPLDMLLRGKLY